MERAVLDDADGADALAEHLGDVRVAEAVDEAHDDDLALVAAEAAYAGPDALAVGLGLAGGLGDELGAFLLYPLGQGRGAVLADLFVVDGEVVGDAEEPGEEGDAAVFVAVNRFEGVEEGLGGDVLGRVGVVRQVVGVAEDLEDVALVEGAKRLAVPFGRQSYKL